MQVSFSTPSLSFGSFSGIQVSGSEQQHKQDSKQDTKQDSVSISFNARSLFTNNGRSKTNDIIDSLMKQKQNLQENKKKLMDRTLEKGGQLDMIKDQLKDLDEQIRAIDDQISKTLLDERKKALGQDDEDKKNAKADENKPQTEQEAQAEKLHNVVSLAGNLDQAKTMSSMKRNMQGQASILNMEISLDEQRSSSPATMKREQLARLNKGISELEQRIGETASDTMKQVKQESEQTVPVKVEDSDSQRVRSAYSQTQQTANQTEDDKQLDFIA